MRLGNGSGYFHEIPFLLVRYLLVQGIGNTPILRTYCPVPADHACQWGRPLRGKKQGQSRGSGEEQEDEQ